MIRRSYAEALTGKSQLKQATRAGTDPRVRFEEDLPARSRDTVEAVPLKAAITPENGDTRSKEVSEPVSSNSDARDVNESNNSDTHVREENASRQEDPRAIRINKELTEAANDPNHFRAYVMELCLKKHPLSLVNIVTILQRAGRNRLSLHPIVLNHITTVCLDLKGRQHRLRPQAVRIFLGLLLKAN